MIRVFKHYVPHAVLLLGLVDFMLLLLASELGWRLRAWQIGYPVGAAIDRWPQILSFAAPLQVALLAVGPIRPHPSCRCASRRRG
jgi:hypothetical protein